MNKFHKLLITTTIMTSVLAGNSNLVIQAQSSNRRGSCQNNSSMKTAYSSGWSAGFNGGTHNNTSENERSRNCYDWGYTDGKIEKSKLDMQRMRNESYIYRMCLSTRILDPSIQCQQPRF
jgi:hypothetical protein